MELRERFDVWWRDARQAARRLARDRLVSGFVVVMLGVGMGAALTSFTLVDRLLLRDPPHIEAPDRLVQLFGTTVREGRGEVTSAFIPYAAYASLRDELTGLQSIGAYQVAERVVGSGVGARKRRVIEALDGYFPTLRARPLLGRYFTAAEADASSGRLAVVGERYWRGSLGADPAAVGGSVEVDGDVYTVVGVAPAGFSGAELRRVDVWVSGDRSTAPNRNWWVVARLGPGATAESVSAEATAIHARTADALPSWSRWFEGATIRAGSIALDDDGTRPFEATMAQWLSAVSGLILLIALGNVINLLLARVARRRREFGVRRMLGSGRAGIVRLLLLEGVLLSAAAGVAGLVVVRVAEPILRDTLLGGDAPWTLTLLDPGLLAAALGLVLIVSVVMTAGAALHRAEDGMAALKGGAPGGTRRTSRLREALTMLQVAFSVVLLVGAGLFSLSMARVWAQDWGIEPDRVLVVDTELPREAVRPVAREVDVFERLADRTRSVPGVASAAYAIGLPLDGGSFGADVYVPGSDSLPSMPGGGPYVSAVGSDYFTTVGTRLLRGRTFMEADREGAAPVLIVNETMARTLWPGGTGLRECVSVDVATNPCARVVGVVEDIHRVGIADRPAMQFYLPARQQRLFGGARLVVRPAARSPVQPVDLRTALLEAEPRARVVDVQPLVSAIDDELRPFRLGIMSFGFSSVLALVVAGLGVYSVLAYMVAWRRHEIGVRSALGATRTQIIG
ncbi:MAG: ABC transporter permease, partial [Gemmatimonadota bacterium]